MRQRRRSLVVGKVNEMAGKVSASASSVASTLSSQQKAAARAAANTKKIEDKGHCRLPCLPEGRQQ